MISHFRKLHFWVEGKISKPSVCAHVSVSVVCMHICVCVCVCARTLYYFITWKPTGTRQSPKRWAGMASALSVLSPHVAQSLVGENIVSEQLWFSAVSPIAEWVTDTKAAQVRSPHSAWEGDFRRFLFRDSNSKQDRKEHWRQRANLRKCLTRRGSTEQAHRDRS